MGGWNTADVPPRLGHSFLSPVNNKDCFKIWKHPLQSLQNFEKITFKFLHSIENTPDLARSRLKCETQEIYLVK